METAQAYEPETDRPAPLQLVVLAQTDPASWFADLWSYVELTEDDLG
jgi:hypothetical protein